MTDRPERPYGSWTSPITIEMSVAGSLGLREPRIDGDDVYWIEARPAERGRWVVVRRTPEGRHEDVTPPGFDARTRVHEYGGGSYAVRDGVVIFSNMADGRLYRQEGGGAPDPLTPEGPLRYGDLLIETERDRVICVLEDHSGLDGGTTAQVGERIAEPVNSLVAVSLASGVVTVLAQGADFYSTPRLSHDRRRLAWLSWRHPNMPWDGSELWVAELDEHGTPTGHSLVAGGSAESVAQPEWAPDGALLFVSDRTGWWNLYAVATGADPERPEALAPMEAEFAGAQWVLGMSWYTVLSSGVLVAIAHEAGRDVLLSRPDWSDVSAGLAQVELPYTSLGAIRGGRDDVVFVAGGPDRPGAVVRYRTARLEHEVLREAGQISVDPAYLSRPRPITFPTTGGATAHALYYPPANPDITPPADERPPLVVMSHGGPTGHHDSALDLGIQVFTSRGFAVVDVNYRGSTGYGRAYREWLNGHWGIVDVDDCANAARYLADRGDVDPLRMAITGGSAGGYTTLCALVFRDDFAAGASHYGVGDLEALARETHKFESRYLDRLVGPYPEALAVYRERSPIHFTDRIRCPVLVTQGLEDRVVPPAQAEQLVASLDVRSIPHAYLPFEGEGHGFRRAENIRRALEAELSFYAQVFGFEVADTFEPVAIRHGERLAG